MRYGRETSPVHPASARETCYGNPEIASEQAINRLSDAGTGIPSEQGINREVSARASEAIGAIDRSRAQFNEAYLEDLVSWSGRRWGVFVTPSWRLPASRACFGIEDKNSLVLFRGIS
jgi:hypothetical protein